MFDERHAQSCYSRMTQPLDALTVAASAARSDESPLRRAVAIADAQEALWGSPVTVGNAVRLCSSAPSLHRAPATTQPPPRAASALRSPSGPNPFDDLPSGFSDTDGAADAGWLPNPFGAQQPTSGGPADAAGPPWPLPSAPSGGAQPADHMKRASSLPTLLACERWQEDVTARRSDSISRLQRSAPGGGGHAGGLTRRHSVGKSASAEALAFRLMATLPEDKPALLPADAAHGSHLHMTFNPVRPEVLMVPFTETAPAASMIARQLERVTRCPSAPVSPSKVATKAARGAPLRLHRASKSAPLAASVAASFRGVTLDAPLPAWLHLAQPQQPSP